MSGSHYPDPKLIPTFAYDALFQVLFAVLAKPQALYEAADKTAYLAAQFEAHVAALGITEESRNAVRERGLNLIRAGSVGLSGGKRK